TVTDNDGDTATGTVDLGPNLVIDDDGPLVAANPDFESSPLEVDESFIAGIGSLQPPPGGASAAGDFSGAFTITPGADGLDGSPVFGLSVTNASSGLTDSETGTAVTLVSISPTEVDGKDAGGDTDFTITTSASGEVTLTVLRGVHHDSADAG